MKRSFFLVFFLMSLLFLLWGENSFAVNSIKVLGTLTHEKIASSGEKYEGTILIKNTGGSPCKVKVYQTDYLFYADGSNIYGLPGSVPTSNAKWLTLGTQWITIPAQGTAPVNYQIQVPSNPDLQGTYWSMLMVEPTEEDASVPKEKGRYVLGLQTTIRYGIQVVTNIKDTGTRRIEFLGKKIIRENGKQVLQLDIKNTGERWLFPSVAIQLYNKDGKLLGTFSSPKVRILPTCSVRHKIALPDLAKGKYKSLVIVDNGDQYVFGANYELTIE